MEQKNFYSQAKGLVFPPSKGIRVQMMPFMAIKLETLPQEILQGYRDIVLKCIEGFKKEGKLSETFEQFPCYITIDESDVKAGNSQRKPGVHTEGGYPIGYDQYVNWGNGGWNSYIDGLGYLHNALKGGYSQDGGIFIASNIDKSTALWDQSAYPGELGDCSHLNLDIKDAYLAEAGELIWMHDRTPHASLPIIQDVHRQFIRIVAPYISHWFAGDNTSNSLCEVPESIIIPTTKQKYLQTQKLEEKKHSKERIRYYIEQSISNIIGSLYKNRRRKLVKSLLEPLSEEIKSFLHTDLCWNKKEKGTSSYRKQIIEFLIDQEENLAKENLFKDILMYIRDLKRNKEYLNNLKQK